MALLQIDFKSNALRRNVRINAILPFDKDAGDAAPDHTGIPYKTLYLLHGIFGDCMSWLTNSNIKRYAEAHNLAVIMPDGENGFYIDHPDYMNNFSTYVGQELVAKTRAILPLSRERADTWIAGFSMGGYGALRTGLLNSDTFGIVCGLSSALVQASASDKRPEGAPPVSPYMRAMFGEGDVVNSDLNPAWLAHSIVAQGKALPKLYLSCGEQDQLIAPNRVFLEDMRALGADITWRAYEGKHDWFFWEKEIDFLVNNWLPVEI